MVPLIVTTIVFIFTIILIFCVIILVQVFYSEWSLTTAASNVFAHQREGNYLLEATAD